MLSLARTPMPLWTQAIHHMNGLTVGPTIAALHARGVLERLRGGCAMGELRAQVGGNEGYLHAAMRFLADLGWVTRQGAVGDAMRVSLSERGVDGLELVAAFERVPALLEVAEAMPNLLFGHRDERLARALTGFAEASARAWDLPECALRDEVAAMLDGFLVAPLAVALHEAEVLSAEAPYSVNRASYSVSPKEAYTVSLADVEGNLGVLAVAFELLASLGWVHVDGLSLRVLPLGRAAARLARTYFYPVRYVPTLRQTDTLIFGDASTVAEYAAGRDENKTRRKHIRFSGQVFGKMVAEPFYELFLPLFEGPLEQQPRYIVDVGCGDANMLAQLYEAVKTRTARGAALDAHPLIAVGVEYKQVALDAAEETLTAAAVPHLTLYGDINDPDALAAALRERGMDLADAVLVTKSVVHTRPYVAPVAKRKTERTRAVFVGRAGQLISGCDMEQSLVELFTKWRAHVGRHGWLLVDAHTVDSEITASYLGRSMQATLDATHNFSHQYLIEMDVFRACAAEAGLRSRASRDLGEATFGHAYMSLDHFV